MERETKVITTPIKNLTVVLKEWISGREKIQIQSIYTKDIVFKEERELNITSNKLTEAKYKTIETVVVSVNDSTENILDTVLDMPSKDYDFIMKEINEITKDEEEIKKK